jgi:hypothetical protein
VFLFYLRVRHLDEKDFAWNFNTRPFFIPENKKLDNLLKGFSKMKSHLAIVVDEYGNFWFSFPKTNEEELLVILAMSLLVSINFIIY